MAYSWCESTAALQQWARGLASDQRLYLDTEFMRERTYFPRLALVQVHDGKGIHLIDTTQVAAQALREVLSGRPLVMHACSEDLEALAAFTGAYPEHVEDTQIAAALVGEDMQLGYQRIVEAVLGVSLAKGATRTDWLQRPLSAEQLSYAEDDVKYLPELAQRLRQRLQAQGRLDWWAEECARLREETVVRAEPGEPWRQVKGAGHLHGQSLAVLAELARWRERTARQRDLPKGFVVRDAELLELSRETRPGLASLQRLGLHPKLIRRDGEAIIDCIRHGLVAEPPEPLPEPLDGEQRQRVKVLRDKVAAIATTLGLKPDVLVRRRWLESLVRDASEPPEALTGWRQEIVTRPLLESL